MKKKLILLTLLLGLISTMNAQATTLIQVYEQALMSDPQFQQALSQRLADKESVALNLAPLLPQAAIAGGPSVQKVRSSNPFFAGTSRGYNFTLTVTQTVFNFSQFAALCGAKAFSRQADATLNAASQDLMLRVSTAYFNVLRDKDNLAYNQASKTAYAKQLDQVTQEYKVGLKTITDVYTARASYDTASASYIAAETTLINDQENLRAITGLFYPSLASLSEKFPLISPRPANMETWVQTAERQNWSIRAALYANLAARENIKQQFGGHLPTVNLQGAYSTSYNNNISGSGTTGTTESFAELSPATKAHINTASVGVNFTIPIFQGGLVTAETRQAKYTYQVTSQKLEQTLRATINTTRQSYLGILAGIKKIQADKQAIKSSISSLEGLEAGYRAGTQTLVDVLNQQEKVLEAETTYATDRYAYVNNLLTLKQAAGVLSHQDLEAVSAWLNDHDTSDVDSETNYVAKIYDPEGSAESKATSHKKNNHLVKVKKKQPEST